MTIVAILCFVDQIVSKNDRSVLAMVISSDLTLYHSCAGDPCSLRHSVELRVKRREGTLLAKASVGSPLRERGEGHLL
jgi:hypothetical protein